MYIYVGTGKCQSKKEERFNAWNMSYTHKYDNQFNTIDASNANWHIRKMTE